VIESFAIEKISFFTTTTGVANHSGCSARKHDWTMTCQLETPQHHLPQKVASMQRIGSGVKAHIDADGPLVQTLNESRPIGRVVDQASGVEVIEKLFTGH
jgi:hypothetical protein